MPGETVTITITNKVYSVYTDFYPDKVKTLTYENYGSAELGRGSRNIERRTIQISPDGDTLDVTSYKYTFDSKARVSGSISFNRDGELYDSTSIAYY